jgi:hypothetical protein
MNILNTHGCIFLWRFLLPFKVIQLYVWSPSKQIVVLRMIQYLLKIKIMGSLKNIKIGLDKYSNLFCNPFCTLVFIDCQY